MPSLFVVADRVLDHYGDEREPAILVEDGVIKRIGGSKPGYAAERRVRGVITPGLVDAHLHLAGIGLSLLGADLRGARSPREVAERLARARGPFAYGRGFDEAGFTSGPELPDRRLLDAAVPDRPALAVRVCGHLAVANTLLLRLTGVADRFPGLVDRERGILLEDAVGYAVDALLRMLDIEPLIREAARHVHSHGVHGVASLACPPGEARALAALRERGELPLRVACYPEPQGLEQALRELPADPTASVVGVKLFADGSFGARTAYLREPYADDPGNRGRPLLGSRGIERLAREALSRGLRVATHAIGDAALDEVLDAYERLGGGPRLRVEHASLAWDPQIRRLAALGVHVVVQPRFRVSDWWLPERLGPERASKAYRLRTLARAGARLALSTDAPVEPVDPSLTFRAALGLCEGPLCTQEESLTPREALHAYTAGAASAAGGPAAEIGRLEPGAPAALTLWTRECCTSRPEPLGP